MSALPVVDMQSRVAAWTGRLAHAVRVAVRFVSLVVRMRSVPLALWVLEYERAEVAE